jgi:hypothetical protein
VRERRPGLDGLLNHLDPVEDLRGFVPADPEDLRVTLRIPDVALSGE